MNLFASVIFLIYTFVSGVRSDCDVVSKAAWGALTPVQEEDLPRPVNLVIIQHTATSTCNTDAGCAEIVRGMQSALMEHLGYWDIGYSFIIGGNGKVYEGTGWDHVGAHTSGYNSKSIGIAFIGNYNTDVPIQESLDAVKDLLSCGVESGHLTPDYHVVAHRQLLPTISPGTNLYDEIKEWPQWLEDVSSIKN